MRDFGTFTLSVPIIPPTFSPFAAGACVFFLRLPRLGMVSLKELKYSCSVQLQEYLVQLIALDEFVISSFLYDILFISFLLFLDLKKLLVLKAAYQELAVILIKKNLFFIFIDYDLLFWELRVSFHHVF